MIDGRSRCTPENACGRADAQTNRNLSGFRPKTEEHIYSYLLCNNEESMKRQEFQARINLKYDLD